MAVENKWVNTDVAAGKIANAALVNPGRVFALTTTFEVAAADDDGSIYKLGIVNGGMIPLDIKINCDAMTGSTSWDLGLYKEDGTVADKDILMAAADLNAGKAIGSEQNGMAAVPVEKIGSTLYELLGKTAQTREAGYILALTANTVGAAAGTVSVRALFVQG